MDHNIIFYLASTVAQALASLVGFLGAFVLFRMQGQDAALRAMGEMTCDGVGGFEGLRHLLGAGEYDWFAKEMRAIVYGPNAQAYLAKSADVVKKNLNAFEERLEAYRAAVGPFKAALFWTGPVLVGSLLMIIWTPWIAASCTRAYGLSGLLVIGFCVCGYQYWRVVRASIWPPRASEPPR